MRDEQMSSSECTRVSGAASKWISLCWENGPCISKTVSIGTRVQLFVRYVSSASTFENLFFEPVLYEDSFTCAREKAVLTSQPSAGLLYRRSLTLSKLENQAAHFSFAFPPVDSRAT